MNFGFQDLLQRAEQLTADMDTGSDLPRVERNLQQLAEAGQRLWSKTATSLSDGSDVKASLLLSSKGLELPKLSQRLEALNATKTFESLEPVGATDIQGFLKNERENAILSAIESSKKQTFAKAEKIFWQQMTDDWETEKQKILNSLLSAGKEAFVFPVETEILDEFGVGKGRSPMTAMEMAYARQIYICNESIIQGRNCNYLDALRHAASKSNDKDVEDTWELLRQMISNLHTGSRNSLENRNSREIQMSLVRNAKLFLEDRYLQYVEKTVYDNMHQARLGGIPGTLNLVRSFIKIKFSHGMPSLEDGKVDGVPVWAAIYYCLRCGDAAATIQAAEGLPPQLSDFKEILKEYFTNGDNRLQPSSEAKIRLQYKRAVRTCNDPFKRIVFAVIGCCDSSDSQTEVASKIDDYIWLKLQQIYFAEDGLNDPERIKLVDFQTLLLEEYGPSHFKAYNNPFLYSQALFLTAQFEAGIEFLSGIERFRCHAVHFAVVLRDADLLLTSDLIHAQLLSVKSSDSKPMRRLNFARLIMAYTRKFQMTDPREALEYFYLLRKTSASSDEDLFASCVSELVLESKEFEMLLGRLNADGSRKPGCIEKFKLDTSCIITHVARDAEAKGQFEDAAALYDLGGNHEKVFEILNRRLSQVVALTSGPQSTREILNTIARSIAERYKSHGHRGSRRQSGSFFLLLDLLYFFDLFHSNQHEQALNTIRKIKLLPFSSDDVEQRISAFRNCSDEIKQCIPDIMLAVMKILHKKYSSISQVSEVSKYAKKKAEGDKQIQFLDVLRQEAKSLVTFAGLLPYRLPGDINARLVQIEIMMN